MNCRPADFDEASILARYPGPDLPWPGEPEPNRSGNRILSWYAVRTATRRERAAAAALQEQGITVFLPMETRWSRLDRFQDREPVSRPLFPGYLFVTVAEDDLHIVGATEGVHDIVGTSDDDGANRPLLIPVIAILEIQVAERRGDYDYTRHIRTPYRPKKGERVQVRAGPWFSFIGKVLATPRGERAHLMMEGPCARGTVVEVAYLSPAP
jgi:transcription antitermination factor NusG